MKKGDFGDCMYIVFSGSVGIYVPDDKCVATLSENQVFGEKALETNERRGATVKAHNETVCLVLMKNDYLDIIYVRDDANITYIAYQAALKD